MARKNFQSKTVKMVRRCMETPQQMSRDEIMILTRKGYLDRVLNFTPKAKLLVEAM